MDISNIARNVVPLLKRNSSTILTGLGVAGSLGSAVLGVKATPTALRKLEQAYIDKNNKIIDESDATTGIEVPLTPLEVVKVVWLDYLPAVGLQIITITCVVGAQSINMRKQAAVISIATVAEATAREYQERMAVEVPTKDRKVRDDMAQAHMEANPASKNEVLIVGNGDQLFFDAYTGRYFNSTMHKVQKAVNDLNFHILNQEYASLNDFYDQIGLANTTQGEEAGWTTDHPLELDYSTHMTDDDRPAVVITFIRQPIANYYKGFR